MITPKFKIFLSAPTDFWLTPKQQSIKAKIVKMLQIDGFEVELMGDMGMSYSQEGEWTLERADEIMRCCQGMVVLGLSRWNSAFEVNNGKVGQQVNLITEFSHVEGTLAFAHHLPILRLIESGIPEKGILHPSHTLVGIPQGVDETFLNQDGHFINTYAHWRDQVNERYHLFFGYSGAATGTAALIINFLRSRGVRVRDWQDFQTAGTILQQIQKADKSCIGGLFLLTKDDELATSQPAGSVVHVPRDNVIFEAGFLISSKGEERVQIILEEGAKLLADLGGQIYLPLKDRNDISTIGTRLLDFVNDRIGCGALE